MPKFTFQLEGVLVHRRHMEKERQRLLAREMERVRSLEGTLRNLDYEVQSTTQKVRETHLLGKLDMGFLAAHRRYTLAMQRKGLALAQEIGLAQVEADKARAALLEEVKKRKALEKLRDRHLQRWQAEQNRRESIQQDELATQMSYQMLTGSAGGLEHATGEMPASDPGRNNA